MTQHPSMKALQEVRQLCAQRRYDEAMVKTDDIDDENISIRAAFLVVEHEQRWLIDGGHRPAARASTEASRTKSALSLDSLDSRELDEIEPSTPDSQTPSQTQ